MSPRLPPMALTFDDGPADATEAIVEELAAYHAAATFFLVGSHVPGREQTLRALLAAGSEIGNHTFSHPRLSELSRERIGRELAGASDSISAATGVDPTLMRPPYGDVSDNVVDVARALGMATVMWTTPTGDWRGDPADAIAERILRRSCPGAVVVLHDGDAVHATDRSATLAAVRLVLPALRRRYRLVTLSALIAEDRRAAREVVVRKRGQLRRALSPLRGAFTGRDVSN